MKSGLEIIADERAAHTSREGWTPEHDDAHNEEELARAAACYAMPKWVRTFKASGMSYRINIWPWDGEWWKPTPSDRIRELAKAGALIAAEIDRINRFKIRDKTL